MLIDCETCAAPPQACQDCVITVLLDSPAVPVEFDEDERSALHSLARVGLVPPLRLMPDSPGIHRGIA